MVGITQNKQFNFLAFVVPQVMVAGVKKKNNQKELWKAKVIKNTLII